MVADITVSMPMGRSKVKEHSTIRTAQNIPDIGRTMHVMDTEHTIM